MNIGGISMLETIGGWILIGGATVWFFYFNILLFPRATLFLVLITASKLPEVWLWVVILGGLIDIYMLSRKYVE